ncbi:unnamed protein product [Ostreobium quekettii]|uniref:Uncharacterized protein n=1 Tax=Ostreobium quekettii TaxID=121088 RepID=A0A8S1J3K1_9CHLO|nr:unnamed protein product [Ostreobium quekettii]
MESVDGLVLRSGGLLALDAMANLKCLKMHAYSNRYYASAGGSLSLGALSALRVLDSLSLVECELGGELTTLRRHPSLTALTIEGCRDLQFDSIATLTRLQSLHLIDLHIFDDIPIASLQFLSHLISLTRLHVCDPGTFSDPKTFGPLLPTGLRQLDLHVQGECGQAGEMVVGTSLPFQSLAHLSNLTFLDAPTMAPFVQIGDLSLGCYPGLTKLGVSCMGLSGLQLRSLSSLAALQALSLHEMAEVRPTDVIALADALPQLARLLLLDFRSMTSQCLSWLQDIPSLTTITCCNSVSEAMYLLVNGPLEEGFSPVKDSCASFHPLGSRVGGQPYWRPWVPLPICKACGSGLTLVLQINYGTSPLAARLGDLLLQLFWCSECQSTLGTVSAVLYRLGVSDRVAVEDWDRCLPLGMAIRGWQPVVEVDTAVPSRAFPPRRCWRSHGLVEALECEDASQQLSLSHGWPPVLSHLKSALASQEWAVRASNLIRIWSRYPLHTHTGEDGRHSNTRQSVDTGTRQGGGVRIGCCRDRNLGSWQAAESDVLGSVCPKCRTPMHYKLFSLSFPDPKAPLIDGAIQPLMQTFCRFHLGSTAAFDLYTCPYHVEHGIFQYNSKPSIDLAGDRLPLRWLE